MAGIRIRELLTLAAVACGGITSALTGADPLRSTPKVDLYGDPLPDGAIARLGSIRFRHAGLSDLAWLPDGKSIATVGDDRVVRTWEFKSGRQIKAVPLKITTGYLFTISADGKFAAACSKHDTRVFDTATGSVLAILADKQSQADQLGFSPDGKLLFVAKNDYEISVWDWHAAEEIVLPVGRPDFIPFGIPDRTKHGCFSSDGKLFVAGNRSARRLTVFDTGTWKKKLQLGREATTSTFTPDGKRLVVSARDGVKGEPDVGIYLFDIATGKELNHWPTDTNEELNSLAVSPDGKILACGANDRTCLVDLSTGKWLRTLAVRQSGLNPFGRPWCLAFSPDSKTLAGSEANTHVRFWDITTGKAHFELPGEFSDKYQAKAVSPDGLRLATASLTDRSICVWDTLSGKCIAHLPLNRAGKPTFFAGVRRTCNLAFSADGRTLAAGSDPVAFQEWNLATGKTTRYSQIERIEPDEFRLPTKFVVRVSADRQRLFTLGDQNQLVIWDVNRGKVLRQRTFDDVWSLERPQFAWSVDDRTLALGLETGVALIDLDTAVVRAQLKGTRLGMTVAMSPDGRLVAATRSTPKTDAETIGVYEVATAKLVANVVARGEFAVASDNRTLFTVGLRQLRAWDLSTGKEVARRPIPDTRTGSSQITVTDLVPLAGKRLFTSLANGTGLVWDFVPAPAIGGRPHDKQLTAVWDDLCNADAGRAFSAVWKLSDFSPSAVVPFLAKRLRPESAPDPAKLRGLIADLNSDTFRVREKATKELLRLGHLAVPALQKALEGRLSSESRQRIEQILIHKTDIASRPDLLRRLRAMQILERIGTKDARAILSKLADGLPLAPETGEAKAALARISP